MTLVSLLDWKISLFLLVLLRPIRIAVIVMFMPRLTINSQHQINLCQDFLGRLLSPQWMPNT